MSSAAWQREPLRSPAVPPTYSKLQRQGNKRDLASAAIRGSSACATCQQGMTAASWPPPVAARPASPIHSCPSPLTSWQSPR